MLESEQRLSAAKALEVNGANRGEKMTKEEQKKADDMAWLIRMLKKD